MSLDFWMKRAGLATLTRTFANNDLTADLLPAVTDSDLQFMGIEPCARRIEVLRALATLKL
jgi:hypothetical protein